MKTGISSRMLIGVLSLSLINPLTTYAGDKEWATAGKILTGFVAANILGDVFVSKRYVGVNSPRYYRTPYYKCRPKKRTYRNRGYSANITWKTPRSYRRGCRPRRGYRAARKCVDPIIVHVEKGRRIYQPRIKGATAYLQVYSKVCNEWVNVEEYPSVW